MIFDRFPCGISIGLNNEKWRFNYLYINEKSRVFDSLDRYSQLNSSNWSDYKHKKRDKQFK